MTLWIRPVCTVEGLMRLGFAGFAQYLFSDCGAAERWITPAPLPLLAIPGFSG